MNRIVLIGNGFDLAHGLNTSYKHFICWYLNQWGNHLLHGIGKEVSDGLLSMKIKDGDICVFEWYRAGSRNGEIVLTECNEKDIDYGGMYTIKKYKSEKMVTEEGWQHTKVELIPLNKDYDVIELDEEGEYKTIGIFKCVLN